MLRYDLAMVKEPYTLAQEIVTNASFGHSTHVSQRELLAICQALLSTRQGMVNEKKKSNDHEEDGN